MIHYTDVFWSTDYITGIRSLIDLLENGYKEGQVSLDYFKNHVAIIDIQSTKLTHISSVRQRKKTDIVKTTENHAVKPTFLNHFIEAHEDTLTFEKLFLEETSSWNSINFSYQKLVSKLESDIVAPLDDFLEDLKGFTDDAKKNLQQQFNLYVSQSNRSKTVQNKLQDKLRQLEDLHLKEEGKNNRDETTSQPEPKVIPDDSHDRSERKDDNLSHIQEEEDETFHFPSQIGTFRIEDVEKLRIFLSTLIEEIPVKKRLIPIPGINNEYFTSENLTKWIKESFPNEDSRSKIEKFGQDLITFGLISNWNKLGSNTFVSDSGYYEFTDLARFSSEFDASTTLKETEKVETKPTSHRRVSSEATNEVWIGLKSKFTRSSNEDALVQEIHDLRAKNDLHSDELLIAKTNLEKKIKNIAKRSEIFENNRVKLILNLHKLFNHLLLESQYSNVKTLEKVSQLFESSNSTNEYESLKGIQNSAGGWYWPKAELGLVEPIKASSNIAILGYDLVNQFTDSSVTDLQTKSIPTFIYKVIERLGELADIGTHWTDNFDLVSAQKVSQTVQLQIKDVQTMSPSANQYVRILGIVNLIFDTFTSKEIIDFVKLWFLELPDSVLPFTTYDSLLHAYETELLKEDILHIIGSIPRQNLSTLLFLVSHLSKQVSKADDLLESSQFQLPFTHLLIRPSPKNTFADINDSLIFRQLVIDLFKEEFQQLLYQRLESLEEFHLEKEKKAQESFNRLKQTREDIKVPTPQSSTRNSNHSLTADGLRQFKTKSPVPSPVPSPISSPKLRSRPNSHLSSNVTNVLSPTNLKRPSDNLSKRHTRTISETT